MRPPHQMSPLLHSIPPGCLPRASNAPICMRAPRRAARSRQRTGWRKASTAGLPLTGTQISPSRGLAGKASARAERRNVPAGVIKWRKWIQERKNRACRETAVYGPWACEYLPCLPVPRWHTNASDKTTRLHGGDFPHNGIFREKVSILEVCIPL